ncbi:MAG TPA: ABC transporter permease [Myxococcota bacterium]|nr:ABC transporter permease [Myxococcota bacterium]
MLSDMWRLAWQAIRRNKLRSALTMLGIVIGVAAVIAMVALGTGAQTAVKERISALGTTLLTVTPGQQRGMGVVIADQQTNDRIRQNMGGGVPGMSQGGGGRPGGR